MSFAGYFIITLALLLASVALTVACVLANRRTDILDWPVALGMGSFIVGVFLWGGALTMSIITFIGIPVSSHYARIHCDRFSEQTERDVKWSRYTYASWDCLVRTDEGWVGIDHVVKVDD